MRLLDSRELSRLLPAETHSYPSPVPTQIVSSDEFMPAPQTAAQQRVEARIRELGAKLARRHGMSRRRFFQSAAGMAAAFVAMNEVYGALYDVSRAEAQTPEMAILGENNARLYKCDRRAALATDRVAIAKAEYEKAGAARGNLRYGYVV